MAMLPLDLVLVAVRQQGQEASAFDGGQLALVKKARKPLWARGYRSRSRRDEIARCVDIP